MIQKEMSENFISCFFIFIKELSSNRRNCKLLDTLDEKKHSCNLAKSSQERLFRSGLFTKKSVPDKSFWPDTEDSKFNYVSKMSNKTNQNCLIDFIKKDGNIKQ